MTEQAKRMTAIEETLRMSVGQWSESGEPSRLQGQPLDLSDDTPQWFAIRLLKKEGFSHPTIEMGHGVDYLAQEADGIREQLRAHCSLAYSAGQRMRIESTRRRLIAHYRGRLMEYNRAVLDFNLRAPVVMQKRTVNVERLAAGLESETVLHQQDA
jgi:hypothetical protein